MTTLAGGGNLIIVPFDATRGNPERISRLIDHMAEHAGWFASAENPEEIRMNVIWGLNDPDYYKWEIWNAGTFAGMFLIHRITPKVDALFHFTLLPAKETKVTLFGAHRLLNNFLGFVFEQFQLQRISVEIPEHAQKLAHFMRQRLGFRYEGELSVERLTNYKGATILDKAGAPTVLASHGSRRERAHWDGTKWVDLLLLRLLRDEYDARALGAKPQATSIPSEDAHVPESQARHLQTSPAAGP